MKIQHDLYNPIPLSGPSDCGVTCFASFRRIIEAMQASGELRLYGSEYVKSITVSAQGLSFVIEKEQS